MGTIAEKLEYLEGTKTDIKNAIIEKGQSVSSSDTFRSYGDKIRAITPNLSTKAITANGTYKASDEQKDGYSEVSVNVPISGNIGTLSVTENGTYNSSDEQLDGYSSVTVNVSGGGGSKSHHYNDRWELIGRTASDGGCPINTYDAVFAHKGEIHVFNSTYQRHYTWNPNNGWIQRANLPNFADGTGNHDYCGAISVNNTMYIFDEGPNYSLWSSTDDGETWVESEGALKELNTGLAYTEHIDLIIGHNSCTAVVVGNSVEFFGSGITNYATYRVRWTPPNSWQVITDDLPSNVGRGVRCAGAYDPIYNEIHIIGGDNRATYNNDMTKHWIFSGNNLNAKTMPTYASYGAPYNMVYRRLPNLDPATSAQYPYIPDIHSITDGGDFAYNHEKDIWEIVGANYIDPYYSGGAPVKVSPLTVAVVLDSDDGTIYGLRGNWLFKTTTIEIDDDSDDT